MFTLFCLLLLSNGINVGIGHTCNTMRVYYDTIITCATADSFCFFVHCVTSRTRYGVCAMSKVIRNNRAVRYIHVKMVWTHDKLRIGIKTQGHTGLEY
jgi:hypothetical protein